MVRYNDIFIGGHSIIYQHSILKFHYLLVYHIAIMAVYAGEHSSPLHSTTNGACRQRILPQNVHYRRNHLLLMLYFLDINATVSTWLDCSGLMSAYRPVLVNLRFSARSFMGIVQPLFSVRENLSTHFWTFAGIAPRPERTLYMASGPCVHCLNLSAGLVQGNCSTIAIVSTLIHRFSCSHDRLFFALLF